MSVDLAKRLPRTHRILEDGRQQGLHPGAQLHVSLGGERIVSEAFGERRAGDAMTRDTLLLWLSAGKPLTALLFAQFVESGDLDLDTPVAAHWPAFGEGSKDRVTPRHILTHTAGFRAADALPEELPWHETLDAIAATPLDAGWDPGTHAAYQTQSGWFVLAALCERLAGLPFPELLHRRVLAPLGLSDTWISLPPARHADYGDRVGTVHTTFPREPAPHPTWNTPEACSRCRPGGSARGPASELGRVYEALLEGGRGVVRPSTIHEFTRRHRTGRFDQTFRHVVDCGLGFILNSNRHGRDTVPYGYGPHASEDAFGHSGNQCACAFADPHHRLVVAWVCNGLPGEPRHQRRQRALNAAIYEDLGLA